MKRDLTSTEEGYLRLVRAYEEAIEDKQLTIALKLNKDQVHQMMIGEELGFFRGPCGLIERRNEKTGLPYFHTIFYLTDFDGYLHFVFLRAGMAILENYTVSMRDGYIVEI